MLDIECLMLLIFFKAVNFVFKFYFIFRISDTILHSRKYGHRET